MKITLFLLICLPVAARCQTPTKQQLIQELQQIISDSTVDYHKSVIATYIPDTSIHKGGPDSLHLVMVHRIGEFQYRDEHGRRRIHSKYCRNAYRIPFYNGSGKGILPRGADSSALSVPLSDIDTVIIRPPGSMKAPGFPTTDTVGIVNEEWIYGHYNVTIFTKGDAAEEIDPKGNYYYDNLFIMGARSQAAAEKLRSVLLELARICKLK